MNGTISTFHSGHLSADRAASILAGYRTPGPYSRRDERREMDYGAFVAGKLAANPSTGIEIDSLPEVGLFPHQRDLTLWALRRGSAAIFADTGLGKSRMQVEWANIVCQHAGVDAIILAPLAVAEQTVAEAAAIGVNITHCRDVTDVQPGINITNYERLHRFDTSRFGAVVLDESSCIKHHDSKTLQLLLDAFSRTPFRLCATATPAPNDWTELGTHAEFLGMRSRAEMLAEFFVHDGAETQVWRLKGHARHEFWRWVATWGALVRSPADLGHDASAYNLPPLQVQEHHVTAVTPTEGRLFAMEAQTLSERRDARRSSIADRVQACAHIVNADLQPWVVWCDLNAEGDALRAAIPGAVEIRGSDDADEKESRLERFASGDIRVLITKPSIAGFGLNWQHCARMAFVGVTDSFEAYYQAVRRCWRFGQKRPVHVHIFASEAEGAVVSNLKRKEQEAKAMSEALSAETLAAVQENVLGSSRETNTYIRDRAEGPGYVLHRGDCVDALREMDADSIDYSIFSPPFASLYTYSNSPRDMGNCRDDREFFAHFKFLVRELYRVLRPGRDVSFHCMLIPSSKVRDGQIGLKDFRGFLIRAFQRVGFIFHSEVVIWKDPVTAMQRTKALGLLHKTVRENASMSRQGIPDYLVTMRKPGEANPRVKHDPKDYPVEYWQKIASPIWTDINPSDTLQYQSAREHDDERHIAPLQLEVIRRGIELWTNPGDVVLSPFAGIASEGYVALQLGRRFVGVELKESYFKQASQNLRNALRDKGDLFG
jgi:DNA modification methylase